MKVSHYKQKRKLNLKKTRLRENTSVRVFWIYLLSVITVGILLSILFIYAAKDALALNKIPSEITISVNESTTKENITKTLKQNGIIDSPFLFSIYAKFKNKSILPPPGDYTLSSSGGYYGILHNLDGGDKDEYSQVSVTIPEGSTVNDIMAIICDKNGICKREDFIAEIQHGDFSKYSFVKAISTDKPGRLYRLEGYLYPDTYCFYSESSAHAVIDKMLSNFNTKFDERYRKSCEKNNLTVEQAVTLASMIVKEAKFVSDYPKISSVFHNRLNNRAFNGRLQSDATLTYVLGRPMKKEDKSNQSEYNTYIKKGLPPSPICNPDLNALSYALYPDTTSYYYFVTSDDGSVLYARSYAEHIKNIQKVSGNKFI